MTDWLFFIEPIIWLCFFAVIFYLLGAALNHWFFKLKLGSSEFFVFSVLGLSYTILLIHLLLALQVFYMPWVLILMVAPALSTSPQWQKPRLSHCKKLCQQHVGIFLIVLLYFLPESFAVFAPERLHDALSYHLPYAKEFTEHHGLTVNTYLRYPLNTLNFDLMFSLGYLFESEILARLFNVYSTLLLVIGIYCFCLNHFNKLTALLAVWAFCGLEMIHQLMVTAYIDLGLTLFIFSAIFMLLFEAQHKQQNSFYVSAIFFGVALGTKYLGLMVLPVYVLWVWAKTDTKTSLKLLLIVFLIGSPWYIRNLWVAGNPFHPFAQQWFGFWLWTETDLVIQQKDLVAHHGIKQSLEELIKLPFLFWDNAFNKHGTVNLMLILGMVLTPVGLFFKGVIRQISCFTFVGLVVWFYSSQIARYLLYVFPFLLIISAFFINAVIVKITNLTHSSHRLDRIQTHRIFWPLMTLLTVSFIYKNIGYFEKIKQHNLIASNETDWQSMLMQKPSYELVHLANIHAEKGVFLLCKEAVQLYFEVPVKGDWYGIASMPTFLKNARSTADVISQMHDQNVDMLLVEKQLQTFSSILPLLDNPDFRLIKDNAFGQLFQLKNSEIRLDGESGPWQKSTQ